MIIKIKDLREILFLDIETVSESPDYNALSTIMKPHWQNKSKRISSAYESYDLEHYQQTYHDKAGIFAEFSKIVCITVGYLTKKKGADYVLKIKTFGGHKEKTILQGFSEMLNRHFDNPEKYFLCGHNIREFDIPFICRRLIINSMELPRMLNIAGKKPWQVPSILDTLELWKFGDFKSYTSLSLLAATLQIPSPKDDIDGSQVGDVYWVDNDLDRIVTYCEKDVVTVVQVAMKYADSELIEEDRIDIVHPKIGKRIDTK